MQLDDDAEMLVTRLCILLDANSSSFFERRGMSRGQ